MIAHKKSIRVITLVLVIAVIYPYIMSFASAEETVPATAPQVRANGQLVEFPDAQPFIDSNNRTLIPVRFATEAIGADVSWDQAKRTAIIEKNGIKVEVPIDSEKIYITEDGKTTTVKMDTEAILSEGRTYVPIRFVAESLGAWVGFSDLHCTVQIYQDKLTPEEIDRLHGYYDMDEVEQKKAWGSYDEEIALGYKIEHNYKASEKYGKTYAFENQNEEHLRNPKMMGEFLDITTNTWMDPKNSDFDSLTYALCFASNAKGAVQYNKTIDGIQIDFKTDSSCVFKSKYFDTTTVRGIATVSFPKDIDLDDPYMTDWYHSEYDGFGVANPEAGRTYTYDAQLNCRTSSNGRIISMNFVNLETREVVKELY